MEKVRFPQATVVLEIHYLDDNGKVAATEAKELKVPESQFGVSLQAIANGLKAQIVGQPEQAPEENPPQQKNRNKRASKKDSCKLTPVKTKTPRSKEA
jgi:hypothetical protein